MKFFDAVSNLSIVQKFHSKSFFREKRKAAEAEKNFPDPNLSQFFDVPVSGTRLGDF